MLQNISESHEYPSKIDYCIDLYSMFRRNSPTMSIHRTKQCQAFDSPLDPSTVDSTGPQLRDPTSTLGPRISLLISPTQNHTGLTPHEICQCVCSSPEPRGLWTNLLLTCIESGNYGELCKLKRRSNHSKVLNPLVIFSLA